MNREDCKNEKISSRMIGLIIIPLGLVLSLISFFFLPVVGLFLGIPLLVLGGVFIAAPESKVCRLILRKDEA